MKKNFQHQHPLEESYKKMIFKNLNKDSGDVAVVASSIPLVPGLAIGMKMEIFNLACAYCKTTNLTGTILSELNQELGEVQVVVLQNLVNID